MCYHFTQFDSHDLEWNNYSWKDYMKGYHIKYVSAHCICEKWILMECSEAVYTYKLYLDTVVFWELENLEHKQVESILHWWSQLISSLKRSERNNFMKNRNSFVDSLTLEFYLGGSL